MTLSVRSELSHSYSYDSKVDAVFKITLVAEKQVEAKGFHHIIVLDTSHSMAGKKLELAKKGAQEYWSRIPTGNKVSFIPSLTRSTPTLTPTYPQPSPESKQQA